VGNSYMAHDVARDEPVVVKMLGAMPFDVDLERVERAVAPLRAFDAASVPRVVELCDARIQDRHCVFLVQEHIEGETLEERLLRGGPLEPAAVRGMARRLFELLRGFHAADPPLLHGDINPRNLIFRADTGDLALVDWGPVKAAARDWSNDDYGPEGWTQAVDRDFVAPEVPMGSGNARSDLYGVGACVAYALTGLAPEAIRDRDRRGLLPRALEQLHVPRSLASLVVPLLEPTIERRLDSPSAALELLLDPLAGLRGGTTVRNRAESVDWHMEPDLGVGAVWSAGGSAASALLALPLIIAALAVLLPMGLHTAGWIIALRLFLGFVFTAASVLVLRAGIRACSPMGRLRIQGLGRALRFQQRKQWIEIPWLQLGRVRMVGPLLRIDGAWCVPPEILPRRRVIWIAPVYEDGLDRLMTRIGAHRARAKALTSGVLRDGQRRWPGARRPPLGLALPVGLFALGAVLFTLGWGSEEPSHDGGTLRGPSLSLEERMAMAAAGEPIDDPAAHAARAVDAVSAYQQALADAQGRTLAEPAPGVVAAGPEAAPELRLDQALHPLDEVDAPSVAQLTTAPSPSELPDALPASACPAGLEPVELAPRELMPPACQDEHGAMVRVGGARGLLVDLTEVRVSAYAACVADGGCTAAGEHPGCYGREVSRGDYPVNCVDRAQAQAWCRWAGRRLCTYAEHERAARGRDGGIYPWGDAPPACERVIMDARGQAGPAGGTGCGRGSAWPVGSRPAGVSTVGALDLSGNVAEWVAGSPEGAAGGGFMDKAHEELQAGSLRPLPPDLPVPDVGFRCCLDPRQP